MCCDIQCRNIIIMSSLSSLSPPPSVTQTLLPIHVTLRRARARARLGRNTTYPVRVRVQVRVYTCTYLSPLTSHTHAATDGLRPKNKWRTRAEGGHAHGTQHPPSIGERKTTAPGTTKTTTSPTPLRWAMSSAWSRKLLAGINHS